MNADETKSFLTALMGSKPPKAKKKRTPPPPPTEPWFKRDDESPKAYGYFEFYRNLPVMEPHPIRRTQENFNLKSSRWLETLRGKYKWDDRRRAFQNTMAAAVDGEIRKEIAKQTAAAVVPDAAFDYAAWHLENLEKTRRITDQLFDKVNDILKLNVVQKTARTEQAFGQDGQPLIGADGKPVFVNVTILKPSRFSVSDAPRFAEAGLILAQYVREQTNYITGGVDRDVPVPTKPLDEMSPAELEEYIAQCREAKNAIIRGDTLDATGGMVS